jgi:hypothetical protein
MKNKIVSKISITDELRYKNLISRTQKILNDNTLEDIFDLRILLFL